MMTQAAKYNSRRSLSNSKEIVELNFYGGWYKSLLYVSEDKDEDQENYLRIIAEECGYPEDEWWRIVDIEPAAPDVPVEDGIKLIITLLNPGKCIEEGMEVTKLEWETFSTIRDKSRSGKLNTELLIEKELPQIYHSLSEQEVNALNAESTEH